LNGHRIRLRTHCLAVTDTSTVCSSAIGVASGWRYGSLQPHRNAGWSGASTCAGGRRDRQIEHQYATSAVYVRHRGVDSAQRHTAARRRRERQLVAGGATGLGAGGWMGRSVIAE
jgi:hypothetical protein